jgi:hypothetical protein
LLIHFRVTQHVEEGDGDIRLSALLESYNKYCIHSGVIPCTKQTVCKAVNKLFPRMRLLERKGGNIYNGLSWKQYKDTPVNFETIHFVGSVCVIARSPDMLKLSLPSTWALNGSRTYTELLLETKGENVCSITASYANVTVHLPSLGLCDIYKNITVDDVESVLHSISFLRPCMGRSLKAIVPSPIIGHIDTWVALGDENHQPDNRIRSYK